jgi:transcriptional regulator with XRE-family HTH domain
MNFNEQEAALAREKAGRSGARPGTSGELAAQLLPKLGERIRHLRKAKRMTLQAVGDATNLTPSMLSLVELGRTIPSIGSLIAISHALGVNVGDLLSGPLQQNDEVLVRAGDPSAEDSHQFLRRVLRDDRANNALISTTQYKPNASSSPSSRGHAGFEHGFIVSGSLTVELEGHPYVMCEGDLISYDSQLPHRIWNHTEHDAVALWINFRHDRPPR